MSIKSRRWDAIFSKFSRHPSLSLRVSRCDWTVLITVFDTIWETNSSRPCKNRKEE